MKKFIELVTQTKFVWGMFFTSGTIIYTIIAAVLGESSIKFTDIWLFSLLTFLLSFIYVLIFGEFILASFSTKAKLLVLFVINYTVLLLYSSMVGRIDISNLQHMGMFTTIYTILFFLIMFSFYNYYRFTGEELNDKLTAYKQKRNME